MKAMGQSAGHPNRWNKFVLMDLDVTVVLLYRILLAENINSSGLMSSASFSQ